MVKLNSPVLLKLDELRAGDSDGASYFIVATDEYLQSLAETPYYPHRALKIAEAISKDEGKPCAVLECKVVWRS